MRGTLVDDRYELRDLVGSGGMAEVYLAHDNILDRDVALKVMSTRYAEDEEFVERFKREAQSAAALSHPNIVSIFDRGESEDGTYYIAMEYLPGGTLKDRLAGGKVLSPRTAAAVALQTARALEAAHKKGIIHRDVKPDNILYAGAGYAKVTDFGIARAAEATTISHLGDILGSVKYMSPEQAAGERVGPASDLYSLGVVLYEMLTGRVPFAVETPEDVAARHAEKAHPRPSEVNPGVPEGMDALVMKLLASAPRDRYASAAELAEDLRRVREGLLPLGPSANRATTGPPGAPAPAQPTLLGSAGPRRRRLVPWILAASIALGAVGWVLWRDSSVDFVPGVLRGVLGEDSERATQNPPAGEEVEVPDVEGLTEHQAREQLREAGLGVEVRRRQSAAEGNAGKVIEQSVAGGKKVEGDSRVFLTVGEASQAARVPDLTGLAYAEAENKLEQSGFLLGGVEEATSETVPAGVIIAQDPPAGATLERNSYVYLTTSVGPPEER